MKFLCIYKPAKGEGVPPTPEEMARMVLISRRTSSRVCWSRRRAAYPCALGAKVRRMDGKFAVIDGPFSEPKE